MQQIFGTRAAALCLAGAIAATSQAANAGNESRFEAFPISADQFEIVAEFSENAIYWCGAAVYAQNWLSKSATQKIYVVRGPSPSTGKPGDVAVRFGFTPPPGGAAASSYSNDVDIVGNVLSLTQARQGCTERSASG